MTGTMDVSVVARNGRYAADDHRWLDQVAGLVRELRREAGPVHVHRTPVPGTKGAVDQLILTLGSAGAFTATVEIVRLRLARDRHRSVELTVTDAAGRERVVTATAENAGADALAPLIAAVSRLAQDAR